MDIFEEYKIQSFLQRNSLFKDSRNHPFTSLSEKEVSFVKKIKYLNGDMPEAYFNKVLSIKNQLNSFIGKMQPIFELGVKFNIYLAGGALRDLLLNNSTNIRDLDVIFDFSEYVDSNAKKLSEMSVYMLSKIFGELHLTQTQWDELDPKQKSFLLIFKVTQQEYNIEKKYTLEELKNKSSLENETYSHLLNKELEAVISISHPSYEYPMDILVINTNVDAYLDTFSFDICKVKLLLVNMSKPQIITNVYDFMKFIHTSKHFLKDAMEKTLTLKMYRYSNVGLIEKILTKHYNKIKQKYSDFKVNLDAGTSEDMKKYKEAYESSQSLNNLLPNKKVNILVERGIKI